MKEVAISVFKAKCLGILEEVRKTRKPIRVTRFGKPVAEVIPPSLGKPPGSKPGLEARHSHERRMHPQGRRQRFHVPQEVDHSVRLSGTRQHASAETVLARRIDSAPRNPRGS